MIHPISQVTNQDPTFDSTRKNKRKLENLKKIILSKCVGRKRHALIIKKIHFFRNKYSLEGGIV